MNIFTFIIITSFSFLLIYKAIKVLDKINRVQKEGIKKLAQVIKIRKEVSSSMDDDFGTSTTYYYTVRFKDKKGQEIKKEIEFGKNKKPKRNPPFSIDIIYSIDENECIDIIFRNSKKDILNGYLLLFVGVLFLVLVIYKYDGELHMILETLNNLFK